MSSFKRSLIISSGLLALLWLVHAVDYVMHWELWLYGIRPGKIDGLWGIILTPLLHGDWSHLAANTAPLAIMVSLMFYGYPKSASLSLAGIWLLSGMLTWLFARGNVHIGFSGINHGLMFFLFTIGVLRKDHRSIALAMVVFFLYGGMIWSIFPNDPAISFELHFFGAISGVIMAFIFRHRDSKLAKKVYPWEQSDYADEDDLIGEQWKQQETAEHSPSEKKDPEEKQ